MVNLFSNFTLKGLSIKNRVAMPPMVCFGWAGIDGMVTQEHIRHYEARAKGGVGLIIVEATCINKSGRLTSSQLGIWEDGQINGLSQIVDVCHKYGSKVLLQLHHAGYKAPVEVTDDPAAPSDFCRDNINARALTQEEIHTIQADFMAAAVRAEKAGFDGIELHGAHGYLISQFMSPLVNKREDIYGGSFENRVRFAVEIIEKVKMRVGKSFVIGYRMGGNEPSLNDGIKIAQELEKHGVDILHVSAGIASDELPKVPEGFNYNWIVYMGTQIKKHIGIPVIVVNGIRTPEQADLLIESGNADFVAIGKALLVDSEWVNKARNGIDAVKCLECARCSWFKSGKLCPRN